MVRIFRYLRRIICCSCMSKTKPDTILVPTYDEETKKFNFDGLLAKMRDNEVSIADIKYLTQLYVDLLFAIDKDGNDAIYYAKANNNEYLTEMLIKSRSEAEDMLIEKEKRLHRRQPHAGAIPF